MKLFGAERNATRLTAIWAVGKFAGGVADLLQEQSTILHDAILAACRISKIDVPALLATIVPDVRRQLSMIDNIERIHALGGEIDDEANIRIHHIVVCSVEDLVTITEAIREGRKQFTSDIFEVVVFATEVQPNTALLRQIHRQSTWTQIYVLSVRNSRAADVSAEAVCSSIVGFVLVRLLRGASPSVGGGSVATFGLGGYYGFVGPSLQRMAERIALGIVECHLLPLSEKESASELPSQFKELLRHYDPQELGTRLVHDSFRNPASGGSEVLPLASWEGHALRITLDRGLIGLDATLRGKEKEWAESLRKLSRTLDMTVGFGWRMCLERQSSILEAEIKKTFRERMEKLLSDQSRSLAFTERTLESLENQLDQTRTAVSGHLEEVETALSALDARIKERPNPAGLIIRLCLWFAPALVACSSILSRWYTDTRSVLFPATFVGVSLVLAAGWIIYRIEKSNARVEDARRRSIRVVSERQEAIVAQNAIAYLEDCLVSTLRNLIEELRRGKISSYRAKLNALASELRKKCSAPLSSPITFAPVLVEPAEYDLAIEKMIPDIDDTLRQAVREGRLTDSTVSGEGFSLELLEWCKGRVHDISADAFLGLSGLWKLRLPNRHDQQLSEGVRRIWGLATPLLPPEFAPNEGAEDKHVIVPSDLAPEFASLHSDEGLFGEEVAEEIRDVPLLVCYRMGISNTLSLHAKP
jgi:hypothetical protein